MANNPRPEWGQLRSMIAGWQDRGDQQAARGVVRLVEPPMVAWARIAGVQDAVLDDRVFEALAKMLRTKLPETIESPTSWAREILMSVLRDAWRKEKRRRQLSEDAAGRGLLRPPPPPSEVPADLTHPHFAAALSLQVLERLRQPDRVAIILDEMPAWLGDGDTRWLAARTKLSVEAISRRLSGRITRRDVAALFYGVAEPTDGLTDRFRKAVTRAQERARSVGSEASEGADHV